MCLADAHCAQSIVPVPERCFTRVLRFGAGGAADTYIDTRCMHASNDGISLTSVTASVYCPVVTVAHVPESQV